MNLKTLGILLILVGAGALIFSNVSYTRTEPVAKVGPLQIEAEREHRIINVPNAAGVIVLLSGLVLIVIAQRRV